MTETEMDEPTGHALPADTTMDAWVGREADDVPPGWMDNVVKRLLEQMNRQLVRAEEAKEDEAVLLDQSRPGHAPQLNPTK